MMKPFLIVIAIGAAAGLMMPARSGDSPDSPNGGGGTAGTVSPTEPLRELSIERRPDGHFYVDGLVNGEEARFLIDTGASHTALTLEDAKRLGVAFSEEEFRPVAQGAGGVVNGELVMLDRISIGGRVVTNARAMVLEGLQVSLLGQSVLTQLGTIEMSERRLIIR